MVAQRGTLRQRRTAETRSLILDAAHRVFASQGYGQASVDTIVAQAGLSKGAFYHHFESKEALFRALLEDRQRRCLERMSTAVGSAASSREAIERIVSASLTFDAEDPDWIRLYFEFCAQATREPFASEIVAASLRECRGLVEGMLQIGQESGAVRADLDIRAAAFLFIGLFDGITLQRAIDPSACDLGRLIGPTADLVERFLDGRPGAEAGDALARSEAFFEERKHSDSKGK